MKKGILVLSAAALAFLLFVKFTDQKLGSFEYVRRGVSLLDRANFKYSLKYFEKAYTESPSNKTIKDNLIYAYIKYAGDLAGNKKYDEAISYLLKAHNVSDNASTASSLAVMYVRRAVFYAHKGQWSETTRDLTNAENAAGRSNAARRSLCYFLFNESAGEYKRGNDNLALVLAKQAASVYNSAFVFEFLGDLYYKKADLESALDSFRKAALVDPDKKGLAGKIAKCERELVLSHNIAPGESEHFELIYVGRAPSDAAWHRAALESAYQDVGKDLGYYPLSKTKVFFYSMSDFRNIFRLPGIARAFYDGNIRMPLPDEVMGMPEFNRYIYHEYTHAAVSAKTNNNCSVWFNEGLAVWEEFGKADPQGMDISGYIEKGLKITIADIEKAFIEQKEDMRPYYILAYTVIRYIVDSWGEKALRSVLARNAKGKHIINAIDDEFLLSEKEFERKWKEYLKKRGA